MGAYVQLTELKTPRDGVVAESDNQGQVDDGVMLLI